MLRAPFIHNSFIIPRIYIHIIHTTLTYSMPTYILKATYSMCKTLCCMLEVGSRAEMLPSSLHVE